MHFKRSFALQTARSAGLQKSEFQGHCENAIWYEDCKKRVMEKIFTEVNPMILPHFLKRPWTLRGRRMKSELSH
jgi:hypothetical protein